MPDKKVYHLPRRMMVDWLCGHNGWEARSFVNLGTFQFCFPAKMNRANLDFDHLVQIRQKDSGVVMTPETLSLCREIYDGKFSDDGIFDLNHLFDVAVRAAKVEFAGDTGDQWGDKPDNPVWTRLPDGTPVDVRFQFAEDNMWLVLTRFDGVFMTPEFFTAEYQAKMHWTAQFIHRLYLYVEMLVKNMNLTETTERCAAYCFFETICNQMSTSKKEKDARTLAVQIKAAEEEAKKLKAFAEKLAPTRRRRIIYVGDLPNGTSNPGKQ